MIKSAMRQALKESLLKRKTENNDERAKRYVRGNEEEEMDDRYPNESQRDPEYDKELIQGSEKGLRDKVVDAEDDGMADLEASSPSEYEGSPEEEMSESEAEAREEGDPKSYRNPESWRDEQIDFMKNRNTMKPPKKTGSFFMAVGVKPSKAHKPGNPRSIKAH